jgi:4a-hydroxytetrahydrobiopterin dehydratase
MKLPEERIVELLNRAEGWNREDAKWIVKKYRFKEFLRGVEFVNEVAQIAERLNHHPMIAIDYKMVTLRLTTWSAGGLTELDFTSAAEYDQAFGKYTMQ